MIGAIFAILVLGFIVLGPPLLLHSLVRRPGIATCVATLIHVGLLLGFAPFAHLHSMNLVAAMLRDWGRFVSYDRETAVISGFFFYFIGSLALNACVGIPFHVYRLKKYPPTEKDNPVEEGQANIVEGLAAASRRIPNAMYCVDYAKAHGIDLPRIHALIKSRELLAYWHDDGLLFVGKKKL